MEWKINNYTGEYSRYDEEEDVVITGIPNYGDTIIVNEILMYDYLVGNQIKKKVNKKKVNKLDSALELEYQFYLHNNQ